MVFEFNRIRRKPLYQDCQPTRPLHKHQQNDKFLSFAGHCEKQNDQSSSSSKKNDDHDLPLHKDILW